MMMLDREIQLPAEVVYDSLPAKVVYGSGLQGCDEVACYGDHVSIIRQNMQHAHEVAYIV